MTHITIRRLYRWTTVLGIIGITFFFLQKDLVWSGVWVVDQWYGQKTASISAPWPESATVRDENVVRIRQESVYVSVKIPRPFYSVDVMVDAVVPRDALEIGVETIPNTLRYAIIPATHSGQSWNAHLSLDTVGQGSGSINFVLRFMGASDDLNAQIRQLHFTFHRPPQQFTTLMNKIWNRIIDR